MHEFRCSIIIVNYNGPHLISKCIETIDKYLKDIQKEVIIVDNNSSDQNLESIKHQYDYVKIIYLHQNMGFGYANNVGVRNASNETLILMNSDVELIDDSFAGVIQRYNAVTNREFWGVKLVWPNGAFQNSYCTKITLINFITNYTPFLFFGRYLKSITSHKYFNKEFKTRTEVDVIYGTIMLIKKNFFEDLGGFSKKYFMYFEDIDFCDRFKKYSNGKIFFIPDSTIIHNVMGSANKKATLNLGFLKSKYLYGVDRFGLFIMSFYSIIDLVMQFVWVMKKKIKY